MVPFEFYKMWSYNVQYVESNGIRLQRMHKDMDQTSLVL